MSDIRDDTVSTYQHLRVGMVLMLVLLLTSVGLQVLASDPTCLQSSISAYYFTPVRAVFVGCLCALGACLIVYRGSDDLEDIAMNAAGALAFVVAFVPTTVDDSCEAANVPTARELEMAIDNNVAALLAVGVLGLAVALYLAGTVRDERSRRRARISVASIAVVPVVCAIAFVVAREQFRTAAHSVAAGVMFAAIVAIVALNGLGLARRNAVGRPDAADLRNRYAAVAGAMIGTLLVTVLVLRTFVDQWIFWLELFVLVEFTAFWVIQTHELWRVRTRDELPPEPAAPVAPVAPIDP